MKNTKRLLLVILSILLIVCTIAPTTLAVGLDIDSIESSFTTGEDEERTVVATTEEEDVTCTITGSIPQNVEASVANVDVADIPGIDGEEITVPEDAVAVDINMSNKFWGTEWQPEEGKPLAVTMSAEKMGDEGDTVSIYHVHENEDGSVSTELMGPYTIENGEIAFEMASFSYVIIFRDGGTIRFSVGDIERFYPAVMNASGNGQYSFVGIYYKYDDPNDHTSPLRAHALLATVGSAEGHIGSVWLDGHSVDGYTLDITPGDKKKTFSEVIVYDDEGNQVTEPISTRTGNSYPYSLLDITLGDENVKESFSFGISMDGSQPMQSNAWRLAETVKVDIKYSLTKQVKIGQTINGEFFDSVTVSRGQSVVYKIAVHNEGMPLENMTVMDVLPQGVFKPGTVELGVIGNDGTVQDWTVIDEEEPLELFQGVTYNTDSLHEIYIRATVLDDLKFDTVDDKKFTNRATIDGYSMPQIVADADVIVKAPQEGALVVSKAVSTENIKDPAPDETFNFTISSKSDKTELTYKYTDSDDTVTINNPGTFTLKDGESILFDDFPIGEFTIIEESVLGFSTSVNDVAGLSWTETMVGDGTPVVNYVNTFSLRTTMLTVKKTVEQEYENDTPVIPEGGFNFEVIIGSDSEEDEQQKYSYSIGSEQGFVEAGVATMIQLQDGETLVFSDVPVGTEYSIKEVLGTLGSDYRTTVNGTEKYEASGILGVGVTAYDVVNTWLQHFTDLTITKTGAELNLDENQSFIFKVTGPDDFELTVTINGNGSVTIKDLPFGTYTVTEDQKWSWRYKAAKGEQGIELAADPTKNVLTFANSRDLGLWLSGDNFMENQFAIKPKKEN